MALLATEAYSLSNNNLVAGVIDQIIERDDLFAVLPFVRVIGKAYVYNRENGIGLADFLDPGTDAVAESSASFTEVVSKLRVLAGDVDVDKFIDTTYNDTNDQTAIQIAKKAKAVARKFHQTLANGNATTNPKEFDGLPQLAAQAPATQNTSAGVNGGGLTLAMLDELCDAVPNGADVLVMRRGTIRAFRTQLRTYLGTDAVMQQTKNFDGRPILTHNGIPVIMNEFLSATETQGTSVGNTCSVYALRLNELDGLHGIWGGENVGISVENIGTVQNKDATRYRLKWYCGLALKSTRSIARLKGVTNT